MKVKNRDFFVAAFPLEDVRFSRNGKPELKYDSSFSDYDESDVR